MTGNEHYAAKDPGLHRRLHHFVQSFRIRLWRGLSEKGEGGEKEKHKKKGGGGRKGAEQLFHIKVLAGGVNYRVTRQT